MHRCAYSNTVKKKNQKQPKCTKTGDKFNGDGTGRALRRGRGAEVPGAPLPRSKAAAVRAAGAISGVVRSQEAGGYLVFHRSDIALLPIINGVWGSALPVRDIEGVVTAGTRPGYFESSHLLNHLFTGLGQKKKEARHQQGTRANGRSARSSGSTHHVPQVVHGQFIRVDTKRGLKIMDGNMLQVFFPN